MTKTEKITFWSDSITVLHWFHQTSSKYKAFVGNRVSETHTIMSNLETTLGAGTVSWRYAPTVDNPANDITRELHPVGLYVKHPYSAWLEFLYKAGEFWPENNVEVHLEEDKRETKTLRWVGVSQEIEPVLGWKRYSSLAELRRVLAYVMRFARNRRVKKELRQTRPVTVTDLRAAQNQLVKRAQVESFGEEIRCLENGQEVHKRNRIKSLDPRMEGGFLVVGGRLQKSQAFPYKTRHPKIIDSHHELAQLIIEDMHRAYHNPLIEHLLNQIIHWLIHCR
ncbi:hypothetical protein ABFA07_000746 [Porites harrisoni]